MRYLLLSVFLSYSTYFTITFSGIIGYGIPCPGIPTIKDSRNGKVYNTVLIGDQCWLRENLNIGTRVNGNQNQSNKEVIEKYCYDDQESNCEKYGGLYQWNEAMQYSTIPGTRGICPDGWHIPTRNEFRTLRASVGDDGNALKATTEGTGDGKGTNTSGFSALLAGYRTHDNYLYGLGSSTIFWSSTEKHETYAYRLDLYDGNNGIILNSLNKEWGFSVRCLKD